MALRTCNAPLDRTVCLTDGLNATGLTVLEERDSLAVLKLMVAVVRGYRCWYESRVIPFESKYRLAHYRAVVQLGRVGLRA